ncbi:hypothetical protein Btru_003810 [Bulinus truncatus]|nr:hypothetical protein Btru_003810 [Bulinus truncatus]
MESTMIADNKILLRPASPESNGYFSETETGHDIAFNSKTPKWLANISSRNHIFQLPDLSLPPLPIKMNHGHDPTAKVISECDVVYSPWSDVMYTSQRKKIVIFNLDSIPLVGHTVPSYYYDRPDTIHMDSASFDEACSNRDKLKMSPCLRSPISPCADDLGNYAMHMNHMCT